VRDAVVVYLLKLCWVKAVHSTFMTEEVSVAVLESLELSGHEAVERLTYKTSPERLLVDASWEQLYVVWVFVGLPKQFAGVPPRLVLPRGDPVHSADLSVVVVGADAVVTSTLEVQGDQVKSFHFTFLILKQMLCHLLCDESVKLLGAVVLGEARHQVDADLVKVFKQQVRFEEQVTELLTTLAAQEELLWDECMSKSEYSS